MTTKADSHTLFTVNAYILQKYRPEQDRLNVEEVVKQEIDKKMIEIATEAEAKGIRQVLESKAAEYQNLVKSCNGDARAVATPLMTEKIEQIVAMRWRPSRTSRSTR